MVKPKAVSTRFQHKSFYLTPSDREMLEYLASELDSSESAIIRRALTELYSRRKQEKEDRQ